MARWRVSGKYYFVLQKSLLLPPLLLVLLIAAAAVCELVALSVKCPIIYHLWFLLPKRNPDILVRNLTLSIHAVCGFHLRLLPCWSWSWSLSYSRVGALTTTLDPSLGRLWKKVWVTVVWVGIPILYLTVCDPHYPRTRLVLRGVGASLQHHWVMTSSACSAVGS